MVGNTDITPLPQGSREFQKVNLDTRSRAQSAAVIALLTIFTLTGSVVLAFWAIDLNVHYLRNSSELARIVVGLLALILSLLAGGWLWGAGVAWWTGEKLRRLAAAGAKGWTGMAFLFGLVLEAVNAFQFPISQALRIPGHAVLTASFAMAVFLVVRVTVRKVLAALETGVYESRVDLFSAGAAVLGYVLLDLMMLILGWELGSYHGFGVSVMRAGLTGAAMFGGAVLGWFLADVRANAAETR